MEPVRPRVDRAVLDFVKSQVFEPADVVRTDGVCQLNPEMARGREVPRLDGRSRRKD